MSFNLSRYLSSECLSRLLFQKYSCLRACSLQPNPRYKSTNPSPIKDEDQPLKYSISKAGAWTARQTRMGSKIEDDFPWFQSYVISLSMGVFLLYFCVFREENDIDEELSVSLYDRVPGLEKKQLELSLQYNLDQGLETEDIKKRLLEIEKESMESN